MKLGIMQPYFFPYLGYFALINYCDEFILFDTPQFIRHGWIERNKIFNDVGNSFYIKVPLKKNSQNIKIKDAKIDNTKEWKEKIFAQLVAYKRKAPYYKQVVLLLEEVFSFETDNLVLLNEHALKKTCDYLGIKTPIKVWSEYNLKIGLVEAPDEWALQICREIGGTEYYNLSGGRNFFNSKKYEDAGLELKFLSSPKDYSSENGNKEFVSIIDLMMFHSREEISRMLKTFELVE